MTSFQRFVSGLFAVSALLTGELAHAATYYVSTSGSDSRSCSQAQSVGTPRLTVAGGLKCLASGDTLFIRGGDYNEGIINDAYVPQVPSGTSWANKVRVAAYPGETVWLRPTSTQFVVYLATRSRYIEFDGINMDGRATTAGVFKIGEDGAPTLSMPDHIRVQNAELIDGSHGSSGVVTMGGHEYTNDGSSAIGGHELLNLTIHGGGIPGGCGIPCAQYGVYIAGPNNLIDSCDIYDTGGAGIHVYNAGGDSPDNNIIRNNSIHDISRSGDTRVWGILITGTNNFVYNNVIYRLSMPTYGSAGIAVGGGAAATRVYNNTIYGGNLAGLIVSGSVQTRLVNNISYGNSTGDYLVYDTDVYAATNMTTNPVFVNAAASDFRLGAGSSAIDRGTYLGDVPFDKVGTTRPQGSAYDIGAYESTSSIQTANPTNNPAVSPDGTRVPSATQIVDGLLAVWTISGNQILRNGSATGGYGSQILWYQAAIYVYGTDSNWWRWTGSTWSNVGPGDPSGSSGGGGGSGSGGGTSGVSPSGTRSPSIIVDNAGATWTIGSGSAILRNGSQANGGYGSQILWYSGVIYVLGTDSNWWRWTGSTWSNVGSSDPSGSSGSSSGGGGGSSSGTSGASPSGTRSPSIIVDNAGATWTIGSGSVILRNGSQANGGYGSQILWYSGVIYVLGTDWNWWRWTGSTWSNGGSSDPSGS
jgi:hypothetical protein